MAASVDVTWVAADLKTGARGPVVHTLADVSFGRTLCEATDTTVSVRCSDWDTAQEAFAPLPGWEQYTKPGRMCLVAVDASDDRLLWAGYVKRRSSGPGPWVECSTATLEDYLTDSRYVDTEPGTLLWEDEDIATIGAAVASLAKDDLPSLQVASTPTGTRVGSQWDTYDDRTIGDVLGELTTLRGGIEWTVDPSWNDDHSAVIFTVRIGPRMGRGYTGTDGWQPTEWTMPGCVKTFSHVEDYGRDTGANVVQAISSGEGASRPSSRINRDDQLLAAYAPFEQRFTPAPSITDTASLDRYAEHRLAATRLGLTQLSLLANADAAPRLNHDWWIGDDIRAVLTCERFPPRLVDGLLEPGYERLLRAVGWTYDTGGETPTITPVTREVEAPL